MIETNPSPLCTYSAESPNSSNELVEGCDSMTFSTQFRELVSLLEDFQNIDYKALKWVGVKVIFARGLLLISVKGFNWGRDKCSWERSWLCPPPIQNKVNEPELRKDFGNFRNDLTSNFSEKTSSTPKSSWKLPTGHPNLEVFLSECEFFFKVVDSKLGYSNFSKREWQTMRALADDRSMVIKKPDKGSMLFGTVTITY